MNQTPDTHEWLYYLEIPRHDDHPVKIDAIVQQRLETFLKLKKIKRLLKDD